MNHLDGPGSVRALTDEYGALTNTYSTDAFGADAQQQGLNPQPFGYTGQQTDNDGLVYLRARYYDPASGRFLSRDPMAGAAALPLSLNRYAYARNDPTANTDACGLDPEDPALAAYRAHCQAMGWQGCDTLTPGDAQDWLSGGAREVDWTNPRDALGDPVDAALFAFAMVGGKGTGGGLRMTRAVVQQVAERWGVDLAGVRWSINKSISGWSGETLSATRFVLYRDAFESEEELAKTLYEETYHTQQLAQRGYRRDQAYLDALEDEVRDAVKAWWANHPLNNP